MLVAKGRGGFARGGGPGFGGGRAPSVGGPPQSERGLGRALPAAVIRSRWQACRTERIVPVAPDA